MFELVSSGYSLIHLDNLPIFLDNERWYDTDIVLLGKIEIGVNIHFSNCLYV